MIFDKTEVYESQLHAHFESIRSICAEHDMPLLIAIQLTGDKNGSGLVQSLGMVPEWAVDTMLEAAEAVSPYRDDIDVIEVEVMYQPDAAPAEAPGWFPRDNWEKP